MKKTPELKNKKVTVMGIGLHGGGVSMIQWLTKQGARVIATDKKSREELEVSIDKIKKLKNLTIVTGQHRMEDFTNVDLVIKNPRVPWSNKYIKAAIEKNIPVEMDAGMFLKFCKTKKIIGVTGTKGKTTTSMLILKMLRNAGLSVVGVGIGQEPVMSKLDEISKDSYVVFELSSWRCSALGRMKISPAIAVFTNIYQDHLNYYKSMEEYVDDKKNIYKFQNENDLAVFNADDEIVAGFMQEASAEIMIYSLSSIDGRDGVYVKEGAITQSVGGEETKIVSITDILMRGSHNIFNACAMCVVGCALDISTITMEKTLKEFRGAHHRLEFVDSIKGIKFYNDTTATTPESGCAGINAFTSNIHLICGGSNKNLVLTKFAKKIAEKKNVLKLYFLEGNATGELSEKIGEFKAGSKVVGTYDDIERAVLAAFQNAQKGEIILLSPGCASFGMFANEFDRGRKFVLAVEKIRKKSR